MKPDVIVRKGLIGSPVYLFAHYDPTELAKRAPVELDPYTVVASLQGEGTSKYAGLVAARGGIRAWARAVGEGAFPYVALTAWSAGGQVVKEALLDGDNADPDAVFALDCLYCNKPSDAKPGDGKILWDEKLEAVLRYARLACAGERGFVLVFTAIATPYGSTGEVARELVRRLGSAVAPIDGGSYGSTEAWSGGNCLVLGFPGRDAQAHVDAVRLFPTLWRTRALRDAVLAPRATTDPPPTPQPDTDPSPPAGSLGERALALAVAELGVHETAGLASTARISEYLAGCERGGKQILGEHPSDEIAWCAAFASFCAFGAADGETPPHRYRAAVAELWADAKAIGATRDDGFVPKVGDLAIWGRSGQDPRTGGTGHVGRVESVSDGSFTTIEGNHADAVSRVQHRLGEAGLVGWIAYP